MRIDKDEVKARTEGFIRLSALGLLLVSLSAAPAFAADVCSTLNSPTTWTGAADGSSWVNNGNWLSGTPNSGIDGCINDGTSTVNLGPGQNGSVQSLGIAGGNILNINDNSNLTVSGTQIINSGAINISGNGSASILNLNSGTTTTLSGGGTITLSNQNPNNSWISGTSGTTLVNADNVIQGYGQIGQASGLALSNAGTVNANAAGLTLYLNAAGGVTNTGTLEATSGGNLKLNYTIANAGGLITTDGTAGSTVYLMNNSTVVGGTLSGNIQTYSGAATLDGSTNGQVTNAGTLTINDNTAVAVQGTINNTGSILVSGNGSGTYIDVTADTILTGGGTVTLSNSNANNSIFYGTAGATLTNKNNTIQGYGQIGDTYGIAINNQSIINANVGGAALVLNSSGNVTNTGTLEATSGGNLRLNYLTNNAGGLITTDGAAGSTVYLMSNSTVVGGTLSGNIQTYSGAATLDGSTSGQVTNAGTLTVNDNTTLNVQGTINNTGSILVSGNGSGTYIKLNADTTLTGSGTVTLSNSNVNNSGFYGNTGTTLTNLNNTIQGYGQIGYNSGMAVNNQSIIDANVSGAALVLNAAGFTGTVGMTNAATLEATNGGILELNYATNNAGGLITTDSTAGSTVYLMNGSTVSGGTLSGNVQTYSGQATIDGLTQGTLTNAGKLTVNDNTTLVTQGIINNTGSILLNGNGSGTALYLGANTTLTGGGTVTLSNTNPTNSYIIGAGNTVLENVNNTIQGAGRLGAGYGIQILNDASGVINANTAGQSLVLYAGNGITNAGLIEATGGGHLEFQGTTYNSAGSITTDGASVAYLDNGATIQGGILNGHVQTVNGSAYLDGSTLGTLTNKGSVTVVDNTQLVLQGTINNTGSILLNGNGSGTDIFLAANTTLTGGGTVTLSNTNPTNSYIIGAGNTVLENVNNTIQGAGRLGAGYGIQILNDANGVINANTAGQSLVLNAGNQVVNQGLIEATGGGHLEFQGVTNNAAGSITTDGASVAYLDNGATIQGGILNGNIQTNTGTAYLDGSTQGAITNAGTFTVNDNTQAQLVGTINNTGSIALNGNGSSTTLYLSGNTTLTGGGTLTLSNPNTNNSYIYGVGGTVLENVNNTIQGAGQIGATYDIQVLNDAGGTILANTAGKTLTINAAGGLTNNGTLQANAASALVVAANTTLSNYNAGTNTLTGGTYIVNSTSTAAGTIQISSMGTGGGEVVNNAATIILNGPQSSMVDGSGTSILSNFSNNTTSGSFTVENTGAYANDSFTSASSFTNEGILTVGSNTTFLAGAAGASTYTQSSGTTEVDGTLTATGGVTINGGLLDGANGTINGNVINGGIFNPGDDPANFDINGAFLQQSGGTLSVDLVNPGDADQLDVSGTATLDGTLNIDTLAGFTAYNGEFFDILNASSVTGTFAAIDGANLGNGYTFEVEYQANQVDLVVNGPVSSATPEPGTWAMLLGGLGIMAGVYYRRQRRNA